MQAEHTPLDDSARNWDGLCFCLFEGGQSLSLTDKKTIVSRQSLNQHTDTLGGSLKLGSRLKSLVLSQKIIMDAFPIFSNFKH